MKHPYRVLGSVSVITRPILLVLASELNDKMGQGMLLTS